MRRRNLIIGITVILLAGTSYLISRNNGPDVKAVPEQSTTESADSILIEKLRNNDTITSLQDPIDTTKKNDLK